MDGATLDAKEIAKLADLESREVLLGKLAGAMLASLSQAVYLLNAPLAQAARLAGALQAKLDESGQDTFESLAGGVGTPAAEAVESTEDSADEVTEALAEESTPAESVEPASAEASDEEQTEA